MKTHTTQQETKREYRAHFIVPIVWTFMASSDSEAEREADRLANRPRELCKYGDAGSPDLGCDALIQDERTIFEV